MEKKYDPTWEDFLNDLDQAILSLNIPLKEQSKIRKTNILPQKIYHQREPTYIGKFIFFLIIFLSLTYIRLFIYWSYQIRGPFIGVIILSIIIYKLLNYFF